MRSKSFLMLSTFAAMALAACTPAKNEIRYNSKRSANQCAVDKDEDKKSKKSVDEDDESAWSDEYELQGEDQWTKVKAVLTQKCVACHAGFDTYEKAKEKIDVNIDRMSREPGVFGFMPQGGTKTADDVTLFQEWKAAGMPQSGNGNGATDDDDSDDDSDDDDDGDDDSDDEDSDDEDDEDDDSRSEC